MSGVFTRKFPTLTAVCCVALFGAKTCWLNSGRGVRCEACVPGREDTLRQRGSGSVADFPLNPINPFDVGPVAEGSRHSWWVYLGFPHGFPPLVVSALHVSGSPSKLNMCCLERELCQMGCLEKNLQKTHWVEIRLVRGHRIIENCFL